MKFLKYLFGAILLLGILFFVKGMITPNISYSSEITVDKPINEAWAVMNDESKISQWLKGIKSVEHVSGEKGTVGAVTKYIFVENGEESEVVETIKEIKPNEYIIMDFAMADVMDMNYKVNYSEKDGKTHIKSETITTGNGMFMKSMMSFMTSTMQAQEDENLNNLKKLINENTTNYFPAPVVEMIEEIKE